jgi:UDP-N-acetylmuramoylalanine--D-glutamate ligase
VDGVGFIDDSISTIPESAVAALDAMYGAETVLIAGGFDRGQDHAPLVRRVRHAANVLAVVALPPSGWRLAADLQAQDGSPPVVHASDLSDAVRLACQCTRPGSVVLLSPAAPSYGAFRDFEERGDAFRALVAELGGAPVGGVVRGG